MPFLELVACPRERNDIGVGQGVEFVDLFAKAGEGHVIEVIVRDDQGRTHSTGRFKGGGSVLEADNVESGRRRNLFDHPSNRWTAVNDENGGGHLSLQFY